MRANRETCSMAIAYLSNRSVALVDEGNGLELRHVAGTDTRWFDILNKLFADFRELRGTKQIKPHHAALIINSAARAVDMFRDIAGLQPEITGQQAIALLEKDMRTPTHARTRYV